MMRDFSDVTKGVKQLQETLGIGGWQLNTASFSVPARRKADESSSLLGFGLFDVEQSGLDTITFLDMDTLLRDYGIDLNLQAIPVVQAAENFADFFVRGGDSNPDRKGNTFYQVQKDQYQNRLVTYNLPDSKPVIQGWGRDVTKFTVTMMLANEDYLDKLRYVKEILSRNLGEDGGILRHPMYGTVKNVFVESFSVASQSSPFNASIININFVTGEQAKFGESGRSWVNEANKWIERANFALNALSTVGNIDKQVRSVLPFSGNIGPVYSSNTISVLNRDSDTEVSGRSLTTSDLSPSLSSAVEQAKSQDIDLDLDLASESQQAIERVCQFGNVQISGYGNGGLSERSTTDLTTDNPLSFEDTSTTNADGVVTDTTYTVVGQNEDGTYTVRETVTTTTPVERPQNKREIETEVNKIVSYLGIQSRLNPENYNTYTLLISSLKNLSNEVFNKGSIVFFSLPEDMLPVTVARKAGMSWSEFWEFNKDRLKGHQKLPKGFQVSVRRTA